MKVKVVKVLPETLFFFFLKKDIEFISNVHDSICFYYFKKTVSTPPAL